MFSLSLLRSILVAGSVLNRGCKRLLFDFVCSLTVMAHIAWHNGVMETPERTVMTLWIASSRLEIEKWWEAKEIPLSEGGARKGQYVGFRDDAMRAIERMKSVHHLDSINKHNILVMEIRLSAEAFSAMATEKIYDHCWVPRLHYVS